MQVDKLSVFFPAHNEENNIAATVNSALEILPKVTKEFEIIVVNDASTDNTKKIIEEIAAKNPTVKIVNIRKNLGYGLAIKTGLYSARFPLILFTDSDGQFDFGEIEKFLGKISGADLVIGFRIRRVEGIWRKLNATGWKFLNFLLFGLNVRDIDCGFKLIKKGVLKKIPKLESDGATISAELLVKAKRYGFKISEVPVSHFRRKAGKPTGANLGVIAKAFLELFKLRMKV